MSNPRRIAVVGGGIAGLEIATQLGKRLGHSGQAAITLIDRDTAHVWKPMLHTIAAGTSDVHREQVAFASHA
uniref:FAD-dependent oxidoreductase n=1 Tax=Roseomonas chloroacetimidivorans TaxID=1766656 RepID=UPI003C75C564